MREVGGGTGKGRKGEKTGGGRREGKGREKIGKERKGKRKKKKKRKGGTFHHKTFKNELSSPTEGCSGDEGHKREHRQVNINTVILGLGGEWTLVVSSFFLVGRRSSQGGTLGHASPGLAARRGGRRGTAGRPQGRRLSRTSEKPGCRCKQHIWPRKGYFSKPPFMDPTRRSGKQEKKLFPSRPRKVGSCLLIKDHIKNAGLQMFLLRSTEASGWM